MKELNAEAYVSCLTLISASGSSFIAINLGQDLMGGCSLSGRACSDWDCLLALKERWHGMSDIRTMLQVHNESSKMFSLFIFGLISLPFRFTFLFFVFFNQNSTCNVGQECGWAGRQRGRVSGEVQRWYERVPEALMFLGRLQTATDNLMIWERRPFKIPGPSWPQSSSPAVTNALIWQG